jgi:GDPmannose 4,6-dehydratase
VREFCEAAFAEADLDYRDHVVVDERFYRPAEVDLLVGDASKAESKLGWKATTTLEDLCDLMVQADLRRNQAGCSY